VRRIVTHRCGDPRPLAEHGTRAHAASTFYTQHFLRHVERLGIPVVNGAEAYALELSKATQPDLLESLGLPSPWTLVINHPSQAPGAAARLRFPVLVKANIGRSGAGIVRYDTPDALAGAVERARSR
jgi:glutathione synthase/RimK-type ligase-like ATP-grasp enzyme